jgi:hypothetical protein
VVAEDDSTEGTVADFLLIGRWWGYYQPLLFGFLGLMSFARVIEASKHDARGTIAVNGVVAIAMVGAALWQFRSVRFTCTDNMLTIQSRRGATVSCPVGSVRRLIVKQRLLNALVDGDGQPVVEFSSKLMMPGDLKRLAAKLGVPYKTYQDAQVQPAPSDPLIDSQRW